MAGPVTGVGGLRRPCAGLASGVVPWLGGRRWAGAEEGAGDRGDAGDVGVGDLPEVPARGGRAGGVAAGEPFAEFGHGADADARVRAVQPGPQRFGQRRGDDRGSGGVAGEQDPPFGPVQPALRGLRRTGGLDLVEDVGVGVIDRDVPVVVGCRPRRCAAPGPGRR